MEEVAAAAIVDARGTVTGWSEGAQRLTGYPPEEVVGRAAQDLLAEGTVPPALTALTGTVVVRHRDGQPLPLHLSAVPMTGPDGDPVGFVVVTASASEENLLVAQAFQQAPVALSVFDTAQRFLRANDRAGELMEVDPDGLAGQYFPDTADPCDDHNQRFQSHLRQVAESGLPVHYESFRHSPSHLRKRAWTIDMWPVYTTSDQVTAVAISASDNSEQHWARQRLMLLNEAATAIGTTLDVVRTAEELLEVAIPRFADFASVDLIDWVLDKDEPRSRPATTSCSAVSPTSRSPRASRKRRSGWGTRTAITRSPLPSGRCARDGRCCAGPGNPTSTAGCSSATPRTSVIPPFAGAPIPW